MLQPLNVSLVVRGPKPNTVFEVRPHQCRVQGHDHFPSPAGHAIFDTSQDAIGLLGHLGTLLAHIQVAVNQHPQVLLCLAAFQPLFPKPVALHGIVVAQMQDLALGLVEPHTIGLGPSIQPVQVPLQSLPTLKQINTPAQLGVVCKLTEGALDPFVQIIDKDIKQHWPQHRALGNTACDRPPTGFTSIHHHSLGPAIQLVLHPAKSTPVQAMSSQFLQENAVGNRVKGFTEVQISKQFNNIIQRSAPRPDSYEWQGVWDSMGKCLSYWAPPGFWNFTPEQVQNPEKLVEYLEKVCCHPDNSKETQITATCWVLAHAYRALYNTIQNPQGSGDKVTDTMATPAPPATSTVATPAPLRQALQLQQPPL
ncbi:hypothetical protein QYF61_013376 [Mycteria americana]|uniref:Uncharacterized protein n=1 Tax=Mycteria americana TaxID=33587 RepID=A0AAN7MI71_MYCAM|nr:hypothetical protein QYF61_013376 [Mycteria americana]